MAKRLGTYRADEDFLAAVAVKAAERGETVTDVIIRALRAYILDVESPPVASVRPVAEPAVYMPAEAPAACDEPPEDEPCRHPAASVDDQRGVCRECGADVW